MERDQHGNPARSDQSAYEAYKAQYAKAAELREVFEKMVNDTVALPEGKRMAISYRFGKISMASCGRGTGQGFPQGGDLGRFRHQVRLTRGAGHSPLLRRARQA
jgi:hypothetical protein